MAATAQEAGQADRALCSGQIGETPGGDKPDVATRGGFTAGQPTGTLSRWPWGDDK